MSEYRDEATERFRQDVEQDLICCSEWLRNNAEIMSASIAGGAKDWEISFRSGEDGLFPTISISVNKVCVEAIESTYERRLGDQ